MVFFVRNIEVKSLTFRRGSEVSQGLLGALPRLCCGLRNGPGAGVHRPEPGRRGRHRVAVDRLPTAPSPFCKTRTDRQSLLLVFMGDDDMCTF